MACAPSEDRSAWACARSDQSLLCTQRIGKDPSFLHVYSKGSDQTGRMPDWVDVQVDLSLHWAHMPFCWVLSYAGSYMYSTCYFTCNLVFLVFAD